MKKHYLIILLTFCCVNLKAQNKVLAAKKEIGEAAVLLNKNLPVKMDANTDSLQMGLRLFNDQKLREAQIVFDNILHEKNNDSEAIKYAGITALRLGEYDKALEHFHSLSKQTNLFSNPGKFYEAITLMKRKPVNKKEIDDLLQEVIDNNLEGKSEAERISKQ